VAEKPDQIAKHIESARNKLGSNLHELEDKVRHEADWKTHFERNPMTLLGVTFGGGVLVPSMIGGSNRRPVMPATEDQNGKSFAGRLRNTPVSDSWGTLKSA
jgi:hypothetical protein